MSYEFLSSQKNMSMVLALQNAEDHSDTASGF